MSNQIDGYRIDWEKAGRCKKKFAIVSLWPNIQAAEREVLERFKLSAKSLGLECVEITAQGVCLKTGRRLNNDDLDFAIHFHFETPKAYDIFSVVTLWNPLQYYYDRGYREYSANLVTHDDFLLCRSQSALDQVRRMTHQDALHPEPFFEMFPSSSDPLIEPKEMHRKIFYIGINWERIGGQKPRHYDLLKKLDARGELQIHGPIVRGVKIWGEFKGYEGELPFDGVSVIHQIAKAGACLVFSSPAHRESELMSSRLFETLAAGAVAICDENPFVRRYCGDAVLYVNSASPTLDEDILQHLEWLNQHPKEACALAVRAQALFKEQFILTKSLSFFYENFKLRQAQLLKRTRDPLVRVIFILIDHSLESLNNFKQVLRQSYKNKSIHLVSDERIHLPQDEDIQKDGYEHHRVEGLAKKIKHAFGSLILKILDEGSMKEEYFCVVPSSEQIYHNHLSALVSLAEQHVSHDVVATTALLLGMPGVDSFYALQRKANFMDHASDRPLGFSRFLCRVSALKSVRAKSTLPYLNHRWLFAFLDHDEQIPKSCLVTSEVNSRAEFYQFPKDQKSHELEVIQDVVDPISTIRLHQSELYYFRRINKWVKKLPLPVGLLMFLKRVCRICGRLFKMGR